MRVLAGAALAAALTWSTTPTHAMTTLDTVRERGSVRCGVEARTMAGLAQRSEAGAWAGFEIDYCRAIAVAALGEGAAFSVVPLPSARGREALLSGAIDVRLDRTSWTLSADLATGIDFAGVYFFDGQGFLVPRALGVRSAFELDGARVCVVAQTASALSLVDFFDANSMELTVVGVGDEAALAALYAEGGCDAATGRLTALAGTRAGLGDAPEHMLLPDMIVQHPLALAVRADDPVWADLVRWTHFALLTAEELGVTADNVRAMVRSERPAVQRLFAGAGPGASRGPGADWVFEVIREVGNYREMFERHLGPRTPLGLQRNLNALWLEGGLHYPMPFR